MNYDSNPLAIFFFVSIWRSIPLFWFFIGEVNCDCDCDCDWDFVLDCVCEGEVVDNEEDGEITSETRPTVVVNEIPSIWQITLYK